MLTLNTKTLKIFEYISQVGVQQSFGDAQRQRRNLQIVMHMQFYGSFIHVSFMSFLFRGLMNLLSPLFI